VSNGDEEILGEVAPKIAGSSPPPDLEHFHGVSIATRYSPSRMSSVAREIQTYAID
jgi:hypothetical protein